MRRFESPLAGMPALLAPSVGSSTSGTGMGFGSNDAGELCSVLFTIASCGFRVVFCGFGLGNVEID